MNNRVTEISISKKNGFRNDQWRKADSNFEPKFSTQEGVDDQI